MAMRRKAMAPKPAMAGAPAPVMGGMKKGGKAEGGKADMAQDKAMIKKAFKQHDMQEHKGGKGTELKLKKGGMKKYATGGSIPSETSSGDYKTTKVYQARPDNSPAKTGDVKEGNGGGYKRGGRTMKMATGGVAKANSGGYATGGSIPSEESYGSYDTTKVYQARPDRANGTGGVKDGNGGGFKKGGATKKHFATGGSVNNTGRAVAMPQGSKKAPTPVMISQLSGTYRKGGKVTRPEAALLKANKEENSASMKAAKKYSVDPDPMILPASRMKSGGKAKRYADGGFIDTVKQIPEEFMRGVRRVGQDLGIAEDPNKYQKTKEGEHIANSDMAKGARNYVRMYKEGLGMKAKNDTYERSGGRIKRK
jgi:hypothetical protein